MTMTEDTQDFVKDITKMSEDFDRWYTDVVRKAELADHASLPGLGGMMVIRPYGYALWESIQRAFDDMIKESGHENAYFPQIGRASCRERVESGGGAGCGREMER